MAAQNEKIKEAFDLLNDKFIIKYEDISTIYDALYAIANRQLIIDFEGIKELHKKVTG